MKKRISSGSRNIIIIDHVSKIPKEVFLNPSDWILQEWLPNDEGEYTIPVSILSSKMRHIQFKRILRYGSSGYAEIMDDFNPELVMKTLEDEEMTGFFGVPTHFYGMLDIDQSILDNCTGSSLKTIISNAAALPQSLKEKIIEHFHLFL